MQTFVPHVLLSTCSSLLDNTRLNKQRLETLQILAALHKESEGWQTHPATKMWDGYAPTLVQYGIFCHLNCRYRHIADDSNMLERICAYHPLYDGTPESIGKIRRLPHLLPWWWGESYQIHDSHRRSLVYKSESYYGPKFRMMAERNFPPLYVWPIHYFEWDNFEIESLDADLRGHHPLRRPHCTFRFLRLNKQPYVHGVVRKVINGHTLVHCDDFRGRRVRFLLESQRVYHVKTRTKAQNYFKEWKLKVAGSQFQENISPIAFTHNKTTPEFVPGMFSKKRKK